MSLDDITKYGTSIPEAIKTLREHDTRCVSFCDKKVRVFEKTDVQKTFGVKEEDLESLESGLKNFFSSQEKSIENVEENDLQELSQRAVTDAKEAEKKRVQELQEKRKRLGQERKHAARVIHVITGLLATPVEMVVGALLLTAATVKVIGGKIALLGIKGVEAVAVKRDRTFSEMRFARGKARVSSFVDRSCRDVRIASLRMIPIVGAQLANQYVRTGSLRGFIDSPAIGGLLSKAGITIGRIAYGDVFRQTFRKHSDYWNKNCSQVAVYEDPHYMALKKPTMQQAVDHVTQQMQSEKFDPSRGITVRIPTPNRSQYHDATLFLADEKQEKENKTVVFYHGNGSHRYDHLKQVREYQKRGYNVLLSSYAGDPVTRGNGNSSQEEPTLCSEKALRDDAAADLDFLKNLGVKNIAAHGWSLGGAQAMNIAEALGKSKADVGMDFLVLDQTFTSMPDAVQNVVRRNNRVLGRLAYDFTKKFMADETGDPVRFGCDGLDNTKKLRELEGNPHFTNTKICCIGAASDIIMGDDHGLNFVHDLLREAHAHFREEQIFGFMQRGGHGSRPQEEVFDFLIRSTP
jgi:hypothetical protein